MDVVGILKSLKTCPDAYAIFETEAARDAALESAGTAGGVEFNGNTLKLNASRGGTAPRGGAGDSRGSCFGPRNKHRTIGDG